MMSKKVKVVKLTGDAEAENVPEDLVVNNRCYLDPKKYKELKEEKESKFKNKVAEEIPESLDDTGEVVTDCRLLGARPKTRRISRQVSSEISPEIGANVKVVNDIKINDDLEINSPVRSQIVKGSVALKKALFDGLANDGGEAERSLKRLKKSCLKPLTPGTGSSKKKRSYKQKKSVILPPDQSLIWEYFRGKGGEEKEP